MRPRSTYLILAAWLVAGGIAGAGQGDHAWADDWSTALRDAGAAWRAGDLEAAERLFRESLDLARSHAPNTMRLARSADDLAYFYLASGRYESAVPLYLETIPLWARLLGPEQPRLATSLHNLGVTYLHLERYELAEPVLLRAIEVWEASLGPEHPETAKSLQAYANLLRRTGDDDAAAGIEERILAISQSGGSQADG